MSDFNGRIGAIVRACTTDGADVASMRYEVRGILRAERHDGWKDGYSDAREDASELRLAEHDVAVAANRRLVDAVDAADDAKGHRWWIATGELAKGGEKFLGPFGRRDVALSVREYVEQVDAPNTFWVDREDCRDA